MNSLWRIIKNHFKGAIMLYRKRILLPRSTAIPDILPKGLHRNDVSDYLLSRTFERRLGEEFLRREVLLKLAASAALIALPVRPARALPVSTILAVCKGTIECGLTGLLLIDEYFKVRKRISGEADAENKEGQSQSGTIMLGIFDENKELEMSEGRRFSIPRYTSATFTFNHGPAPQESGSKTFAVASEDSADSVDFEVP
jgi:hypothetical protein